MKQEERVIIITGGAQGIGLGIAQCFARRHYRVALADVKETQAQQAAATLEAEGAPQALGIGCDITDPAQVESAVQRVMEEFGRIDVLVNNAGISPFVDVMELSPELFHKVLDVNLTGAFYCTQSVAKRMIERGEGGAYFSFRVWRRSSRNPRRWSTRPAKPASRA